MIWLFHYLHSNCWKSINMINSVNPSCPVNPGSLVHVFMKTTIDPQAADKHRYQAYSRISHHIDSDVEYILRLTNRRLAGHPVVTYVHASLEQVYYWPRTVVDVNSAVRGCVPLEKNRGFLLKRASPLSLFPNLKC